jgi:lysophospholipase L1-like esterase
MIVFYSGDNDLAGGMSPQDVADDTKAFIDLVRRELPQTRLVFIAIKPSVARWKLIDQVRQTNRQTKSLVQALPGSTFIDVESQILGADGKPQAELFQLDGLHLNAKGYEILNAAVRPYLTR